MACGTRWLDWIIPDSLFGIDFSDACRWHDDDYSAPGGKTRDECDDKFLGAMVRKARKYGWWRRFWARRFALDYYAAVCDFGQDAWNCCRANDHATSPNHPG